MNLVPVEAQTPLHDDGARVHDAMSALIACMGRERFDSDGLAALNRCLPLRWWSVYRLFDDRPPAMYASGTFGTRDDTRQTFGIYRDTLYRKDETFIAAKEFLRGAAQAVVHWHASEIPREHREPIYTRNRLSERLSIVSSDDQGLLAVNVYRQDDQDAFTDREIEQFRGLSTLLLACVRRHIELIGASGHVELEALGLNGRERDVCERLLKGWTYDGIAADLKVSPATVKTYRDRAFARLNLHHRNELFALASGRLNRERS